MIAFLVASQRKDLEFVVVFVGGDEYHLSDIDIFCDDEITVKFVDSKSDLPHDYIRSCEYVEIAENFNVQTMEIVKGERESYNCKELPDGFMWSSGVPSEAVGMLYASEDILRVYDESKAVVVYERTT